MLLIAQSWSIICLFTPTYRICLINKVMDYLVRTNGLLHVGHVWSLFELFNLPNRAIFMHSLCFTLKLHVHFVHENILFGTAL